MGDLSQLPYDILNDVIRQGLRYSDIINLCQGNKQLATRLCRNQDFWRRLVERRYPHYPIEAGVGYRRLYQRAEVDYIVIIARYDDPNNPLVHSASSKVALYQSAIIVVTLVNRFLGLPYYYLAIYNPNGKLIGHGNSQDVLRRYLIDNQRESRIEDVLVEGYDVYRITLGGSSRFFLTNLGSDHLIVIPGILTRLGVGYRLDQIVVTTSGFLFAVPIGQR